MLATRTTVVGVFPTRAAADRAVAELHDAGFPSDRIGMIAKDDRGRVVDTRTGNETFAEEGATAGAGVGTAIGLAVVAGMVPVVGPVLALGTLGTVLLNAAGGAVVAGVAGALIGWGVPEEEAKYFEGEVRAGRFLVTVDAGERTTAAETIMFRNGGGYDRPVR